MALVIMCLSIANCSVIRQFDSPVCILVLLECLIQYLIRYSTAGYKMPHPLVFDVHVKVETMDHRTTPIKVFEAALEDLTAEVDTLSRKFEVRERLSGLAVCIQHRLKCTGGSGARSRLEAR